MSEQEKMQQASSSSSKLLLGVKKVDLALVEYLDDRGAPQVNLAIVGEKTVHFLDGRAMGLVSAPVKPGRVVNEELANAILTEMKK